MEKDKITFFKRRYFDLRLGGTMVSPFIQMANFIAILFLYVRHLIPVEIFAPLFAIAGMIALSYIGVRFRRHQATTEAHMIFEKQVPQATSFYLIMDQIAKLSEAQNIPLDKKFIKQLQYLKAIAEKRT